ncbi:MAG: AmmeMemoRadiSam system protein B [Thermoguttaceae bacterium]|nr:AmmeMemoRadiSam system protein B [Thermoguttaceae bacterium]MDW8036560.1 AmmeMemoRadiSam system protein B [Thermoguttaceae bacterium]
MGASREDRLGRGSEEPTGWQPIVPERPELSEAEKQALFEAAAWQVAASVCGWPMPPLADRLPEIAGKPVFGSFVSLKRAKQLRSCCGYLGGDCLLAEAVQQAAHRAAKDDPRFPPIEPEELDRLHMDVWLLWNLEPVAGQGEERCRGFEIGRHGLQVIRGEARGLLLPSVAVEHHLDAQQFLEQTCLKAHLPPDAWKEPQTTVLRFEGYAISGPFPLSVRHPVQAGRFYPASPAEIQRELDVLLAGPPAEPKRCSAILVPHAGWMFSGRVAGTVLRQVDFPERAIVFCPAHTPGLARWAVAPHDIWILPGGGVASDRQLAGQLAEAIDGWQLDPTSHQYEHAIEVLLPFLARLAPQMRVVGVAILGGKWAELRQFADQLARFLQSLPELPLLIISSDMHHEELAGDAQTRRLDRLALDALEAKDTERLYRTCVENHIAMCGMRPAVLVLETLRRLGLLQSAQLVAYATSAEAELGRDSRRVVGYAGMIFQ